jgi:cytochrome c oxidase subunit II
MIIPIFATSCSGPLSTLDPAGTGAAEAALLWWGMFGFFTLVLFAVIAVFVYAVRRAPDNRQEPGPHTLGSDSPALHRRHQAFIIGGGVVLPVISIVTLLVFGIPAGNRMAGVAIDPDQALRIEITGHQWWWEVRYQNQPIFLRDEVHIPAGVPVRLQLLSADVIHSFWVPRIGQKLDMIPGHVNELFLQADEPGVYPGVCAEFCGLAHAHMKFDLIVHTPEDFAAWQAAQPSEAAE